MTNKPERPWSLARAARSARDARIAAIRYMRSASVEREWFASMLAHGHEARTARTGDPDTARALQLATMGYSPPYPEDWARASQAVLADEAHYLAEAELYVLTPQMMDVVVTAAQALTFEDLGLLAEDDLPSPSGLVVLPRPLRAGGHRGGQLAQPGSLRRPGAGSLSGQRVPQQPRRHR